MSAEPHADHIKPLVPSELSQSALDKIADVLDEVALVREVEERLGGPAKVVDKSFTEFLDSVGEKPSTHRAALPEGIDLISV